MISFKGNFATMPKLNFQFLQQFHWQTSSIFTLTSLKCLNRFQRRKPSQFKYFSFDLVQISCSRAPRKKGTENPSKDSRTQKHEKDPISEESKEDPINGDPNEDSITGDPKGALIIDNPTDDPINRKKLQLLSNGI